MPTTNDWELTYVENGEKVTAANMFIDIPNIFMSYDRYYFDTKGKMLYGWLNTAYDGNWYYFETGTGANRGKMIVNTWKQIQGKWYYFGQDGIMYKNQITPDGYLVNENGEWVK